MKLSTIISHAGATVLEARQGLLRLLREKLPNVPEYVLNDLFYKNLKDVNQTELIDIINDYTNYQWTLVDDFPVTYDIFNQDTRKRLAARSGGKENPYQVPNDAQRHKTQRELMASRGMPTEPLILLKDGDKYELLEGWHRTIQLLNVYPDGFKYPSVYIGQKTL
jgi:hypothetical protein